MGPRLHLCRAPCERLGRGDPHRAYDRLCYQVGNGNRYVEGLEICEATNAQDFQHGIEIAALVVRERLAAHGWGIDRLI